MIERRDITVGAHTYTIQQLGARVGLRVFAKLARAIGEPMAMAKDDKLTEAIRAFVANPSLESDLVECAEAFAGVSKLHTIATFKGGRQEAIKTALDAQWDDHFAGRYDDLVRFLWEHITYNFASFLAEARNRATQQPAESSSPVPSSGGSGD